MSVHRIRVDHESGAVVMTAEGELDAYAAPGLSESLEDLDASELDQFVIDLSRVSFLDSTALGLLVRAVKGVGEHGGQVRVVLPNTMARRIFEITTLDRVLPVAPSLVEALRELRDGDGTGRGSA